MSLFDSSVARRAYLRVLVKSAATSTTVEPLVRALVDRRVRIATLTSVNQLISTGKGRQSAPTRMPARAIPCRKPGTRRF
jgi:hypothetical protein